MTKVPYYDPEIAAELDKRQQSDRRRRFNQMVKQLGGSWKCQAECGRTISANKLLCNQCWSNSVAQAQQQNAVDVAS